ncbi:helix-turn-helix domain-containing protein [Alicyclobacillus fodiniaquatilis]|uniref:Helix-turn-helix domain-containing protein n=1 Tax=Alicyclobacillus fodiniaquatilis TaxID=1661150 RepID=A0ABW4JF10_9BACL
MRKLLTVKEVSKQCSIDKTTIYKWIQAGTIPSVKIGTCVRIPEDAMIEMIESQLQPQL